MAGEIFVERKSVKACPAVRDASSTRLDPATGCLRNLVGGANGFIHRHHSTSRATFRLSDSPNKQRVHDLLYNQFCSCTLTLVSYSSTILRMKLI